MKRIFFLVFIFYAILLNAQTEKADDLVFNTVFADAEGNYISFSPKESDKNYILGYVYVDEIAGYSFRYLGDFVVENNKYRLLPNEELKKSFMTYRWDNLTQKVGLIPKNRLSELNQSPEPDWMKFYKSTASNEEKMVNRASFMNGSNNANLALPILQKLYKNNFKTQKLFFELSFAYNALGKFAEAEAISSEALNNYSDDLLIKEYIYALLNQSKFSNAEQFLSANFSKMKSENYKAESVINMIAYLNHAKDFEKSKKWLQFYKNEIKTKRYDKNIQQFEAEINNIKQ